MSLRILHVLDHSVPLHSGYAYRTLSILRAQRALGWQPLALTSGKQGGRAAFESVEGFDFYRTQPTRARGAAGALTTMTALHTRLEQVVRSTRPHLIQAHSPVLNAWPAIAVARAAGVPLVYEVRAFWEDAAVDHGTTREGSLRYRLSRWMESRAFFRAQHITTICEGLAQDIRARGVAADKVTVIPNAVDVARFDSAGVPDAALADALGLTGKVVLGFIGSFYAYEGLDLLVAALARVRQVEPSVVVLLVGGGPASVPQGPGVVSVGRVPHHAVGRYYDLIDLLVYPRRAMRLTELVTPLKPLEAMAQGRLVLASNVGGHRELIRDGDNGFLHPPDDAEQLAQAILSLLARRAQWPAVRARARQFVEAERTWGRSVARYVPVFERLAGRV